MHSSAQRASAKATGRFYTSRTAAAFVTDRVVTSPRQTVLDPSCGNGVFLVEAAHRLRALGSDEGSSLTGIDLDADACVEAGAHLSESAGRARTRIINRDFFSVDRDEIGGVGVVLGNPPFLRYQVFAGRTRKRALKRAEEAGVVLSQRSNAWAPFVIHAMSFMNAGGRLGLILPAELLHARYASAVLNHVLSHFSKVTILAFEDPLFPALDIRTIGLVGTGFGGACADLEIVRVDNTQPGSSWDTAPEWNALGTAGKDSAASAPRVSDYYLPPRVRSIFRKVAAEGSVRQLGDLASVDIGYVTGDNDFFHLSKDGIRRWGIPREFVVRALRSGRRLKGCVFTREDWEALRRSRAPCYLLRVPGTASGSRMKILRPYLGEGLRRGVDRRYRSRAREPWYSVRGARIADGFLTSMSSGTPKILMNEAKVVASNNLHVVTTRQAADAFRFEALVASWYSSYSMISSVLEGHVLGGGLRKLEPCEAERVKLLVPRDPSAVRELAGLVPKLDERLRESSKRGAMNLVDDLLLTEAGHLTTREADALKRFARLHVVRTSSARVGAL